MPQMSAEVPFGCAQGRLSTGVISRKAKDHAALRMTDRGEMGECFAGKGGRATPHASLPRRSYLASILAGE
jgi:hypothetical protein